jgi:phospholipase/carboxylesterase
MDCTRRNFVEMMAAGAGGLLGCGLTGVGRSGAGSARLTARPANPTGSVTVGLNPLGLSQSRDGYLYVPAGYRAGHPMPFLLALHGAGIPARGPLNLWSPYADSHGFLLLSVDSADYTWDAIRGSYGTDVAFIDSALRRAFGRVSVDPAHLAVSGFSDGASYALGLGLANGDLFRRTLAHSPGFIAASDSPPAGHTEFFFSHGVQDPILPIEYASRRIVPELKRDGYSVTYVEFQGGHQVPPEVAAAAVTWFLR